MELNNLLKADLFRIRHTKNLLFVLISCNLCSALLQFTNEDGFRISNFAFFTQAMIGLMVSILATTWVCCSTFDNRVAHYELMKGTPPMLMILSRIMISLFFSTVFYFLPTVILLKIFDGSNLSISMILLTYVCLIKITVLFVSMCVIANSTVGAVVPALFMMFSAAPLFFLQNIVGINVVPFAAYLTTSQLMLIGRQTLLELEELSLPLDASYFELKIIASFIILSAVFILLAYKALKSKKHTDKKLI